MGFVKCRGGSESTEDALLKRVLNVEKLELDAADELLAIGRWLSARGARFCSIPMEL